MPPQHDMVLASGTLGRAAFADRLVAASAAGFTKIGLHLAEYRRLLQMGWTDDEISTRLGDHGIELVETEFIAGFAAPPGPANLPQRPNLVYASPDDERTAFHLADRFGVRTLQATGTFGTTEIEPNVVDSFAALCDRASQHDLAIALEFVPYTNIPDVETAASIVREADRANGGLCVDSWHYFQGSLGDLAAVPASDVAMIQINDGLPIPAEDDRMEVAVHGRRLPGDGTFDLAGFLGALQPALETIVPSIEVFSDELDRLPSAVAARALHDSTGAVLASLRSGL